MGRKDEFMKQETDFSSLERLLYDSRFCDWQGDAASVWRRYVLIKEQKEVYMTNSSFRWVIALAVVVLMVVGGVFGMGWLFEYQKFQKLDKGEAILVTMTIGDVKVRKMGSDSWREVMVEDIVEMGDTLKTGEGSACELQIVEKGVYRLEANTEMLVSKLVNQNDTLQARMHVEKGTLGLKPKKLKEGEVFEVESSTAVAAVRGTVFMVNVSEEGDTKVAVVEGKVEFAPKVAALDQAKADAKIDEKAYEALQEVVAKPVVVEANEEVLLPKATVDTVNKKVAEVVEAQASSEGPITVEKVEEVKQAVVTNIVADIAPQSLSSQKAETSSLVAVVVQKREITEEAKQILGTVQNQTPVGKKWARVMFSTDIEGAEVVLNGQKIGITPLAKVMEVDTTYTVTFEKEGYEMFTQDLVITGATNIYGVLKPKEITQTISAAGEESGETLDKKLEVQEQPGERTVKPGDILWEKPFSTPVSPFVTLVKRGKPENDRFVFVVDNRIVIVNLEGEVVKSFTAGTGSSYDFSMVAHPSGIFTRDDDGTIYAYDFEGNLKWSKKFAKTPAWAGMGIAKKNLVVVTVLNKILFLSMEKGEIVQTVESASTVYATPFMVDEKLMVYAQENGLVVGYDTANNQMLWKTELSERVTLPVYGFDAKAKKVAVIAVPNKLIGFDAVSGQVLWEKALPGVKFTIKPLSVGRKLYVVNKNQVQVIDMFSGAIERNFTAPANILSFQVEPKTLYILDEKGKLQAYSSDGKVLWTYDGGTNVQSLAVHPEGVYVFRGQQVVKLLTEVGFFRMKPGKSNGSKGGLYKPQRRKVGWSGERRKSSFEVRK
ncbi:outer membrane protein assembly factor BamB family protein [Thermospira aquatica]|uniref:PQQ-binding-like beta-propeller repeat protein n=1 Tax=Thermospira aquatica TaxID=2828656 RepID=A0AAX3BAY0_9SPIR|nr:PQQ-binding-like beta-propeller repeat protein [Thermospira aquatica]URA09400.1 PQQ-binding-like beta-propeller repeat protein [Thermospira aquatica]